MPEFRYAGGRILESIQYMSEELAEFQNDYAGQTWKEYQADRKLQKLIDRAVDPDAFLKDLRRLAEDLFFMRDNSPGK